MYTAVCCWSCDNNDTFAIFKTRSILQYTNMHICDDDYYYYYYYLPLMIIKLV